MAARHPGKWKPVFVRPEKGQQPNVVLNTEQIASHACLIYNQQTQKWKVLYGWPVYREGPNSKVRTRIWDPNPNIQNPISAQEIPEWPGLSSQPSIFCGGHVFMSSGKILWAGGIKDPPPPTQDMPHPPSPGIKGLNYTYIFDPTDEVTPWKIAGGVLTPHALADGRFYPTLTQLGVIPRGSISGKIVAMSGWIEDGDPWIMAREPQFYDEANGWRYFPYTGATQPFNGHFEYYPGAYLIPAGLYAGMIFYCIPMKQSYVFNPFWNGIPNGGYWQPIGGLRSNYRLNGTSTMLPLLPPYTSARVILIGGSTSETQYESYAINSADVIDIASTNPQWTFHDNFLFFARRNHMSVILPDDMLFVVGGNVYSHGQQTVYTAELVDTNNLSQGTTMLPAHVYPREHHSIASLLPDATVLLSGSGNLGEQVDTVYYMEIYEPGYLFEGERPVITSAPLNISYGSPFNIVTSLPIAASPNGIRLIRLGAITHSTDMTQLSVGLAHETGPANGSSEYTVTPPPNANIAPPGLYMLFVLRPKSVSLSSETMIPSVAKIVKLS